MNLLLNLKCLLLNISLVGLFQTNNSQNSDNWRLRRLKNTSVYKFFKQNNHDQFRHLDYQDQYFDYSNLEHNQDYIDSSSVLSQTYKTNDEIIKNIRQNSGTEEEVNIGSKSVVPMSLLKVGNYSVKTKEYNQLSHPDCGLKSQEYIVGGKERKEGSYPWIAGLMIDGMVRCSANIINEWWVLTVAHCYYDLPGAKIPERYAISVGTSDLRRDGTVYGISKIVAHQDYSGTTHLRDIALMKVKGPIKWSSTVRPICLPKESYQTPKANRLLTVVGWGKISWDSDAMTTIIREVQLKVIPIEECAKIWAQNNINIYKSQICTLDVGKDACVGDSGGPAIDLIDGRATIVGLVSFGKTCADDFPGVFTKVSFYINWIKLALKPQSLHN